MTQLHPTLMARPPRDTRIDIVRGWLQLTIFASHAAGSWIGAWLIHGTWGVSDSSEQFVFLSGLMLGSVFTRKSIREGWSSAARDMMRRTWRLYRTQMIVFALFGAMILAADLSGVLPGETTRLGWHYLLARPARAALAALTTLYQPAFMDILPVFIWCMLAMPGFAWLEARFGDRALLAPVAIYLAAQFGLRPPSLSPENSIGLNPFAWQLLFMTGAWLGRRMLLHGRALPPWRWMTVAAFLILTAALLLRLDWFGFLPWHGPVVESDTLIGKDDLVLARVLHALALAWLIGCFVPKQARWMLLAPCRWLAAAGRFSLQVFCLGLFLSWGVTVAFRLWPDQTWWLDPLLLAIGCAALLRFGLWLDRDRSAGARYSPGAEVRHTA
jgi:hypothetical protein